MVSNAAPDVPPHWLRAKRRCLAPVLHGAEEAALTRIVEGQAGTQADSQFANPFTLDDLLVLDETALHDILDASGFGAETLARGFHGASHQLVQRVLQATPEEKRAALVAALERRASAASISQARHRILDAFFWELTYWKTPDLYEELTLGEPIHPGIFRRLAPDLRGHIVLDAGAGSGRATFACLDRGAARVYALEPSPGLLRILDRKRADHPDGARILPLRGRFGAIPLADDAVDVALSCSAFTSEPEHGGEPGLAELRRVTRTGGHIVLIWPRPEDYGWLAQHGFRYVALPLHHEMRIRFRSLRSALRVVHRFYARNHTLARYLLQHRGAEVPYSLVGPNPPHDYCWLRVK
ncbi:MAG TPA: methyltransferase domain-containing protein [Ktedonobacterales bacterium]|jgi:SAM-dependent methyltransferase|nr:methyltransferase domain-containing protein [Ktedonobacterales bacterium]